MAVLVSSATFAVVQIASALMLHTFFLGLTCALLVVRRRSLWAPLALHAVDNTAASLVVVAALTA